MKVNGIDARKYDAKQLTVETQPPQMVVNYEWLTGALLPTEFETDGTLEALRVLPGKGQKPAREADVGIHGELYQGV